MHEDIPISDEKKTKTLGAHQHPSAVEALEAAGAATGAEDLKWNRQRDAIDPYAGQTFFRARELSDGQARASVLCIAE
jgi:hypothetical protein